MRVLIVVLGLTALFAVSAHTTPAMARYVSIEEVRDMAFARGIVRIDEIELDDGIWEVEGEDAEGNEIEMEVDSRTGRIIKMKLD